MEVGNLVADLGDTHIYENHFEAVKEQLQRDPNKYELPKVIINEEFSKWWQLDTININALFYDLRVEDFQLENYQHYPKLENLTPLNTGLV